MELVTRTYQTFEDARNVVVRLEAEGVPSEQISLIGRQQTGDDNAAEGATIGGVAGGAAGLLAGLGVVAIPGIGPAVAIGWLASMVVGAGTGALAGGAIGAATETRTGRADAAYYAETVRRGGSVVSVKVDEAHAPKIRAIMDAGLPINDKARRQSYEREGWAAPDGPDLPRGGS